MISSPVKVLSIVALATLETLAPGKDGFRSLKTNRAAVTVRTLSVARVKITSRDIEAKFGVCIIW